MKSLIATASLLVAALIVAAAPLGIEVGNSAEPVEKKVEKKAEKSAGKCPVSGQAAKLESALAYKGVKVFFCCDNCPKAFAKDPAKFAVKANHQLATTGQLTQIACPISGQAADASVTEDVAGAKVAFCCEVCQGKVKAAEGDKKVALVFTSLEKGFTVQTQCPVSKKPISAEHFVEHEGKKVYFCCPNCPAGFKKDPAKFIKSLPQFAK